jgi:predicted dehydrogenase
MNIGVAGLRFGMSWAKVFDAYDETDLIAICDLDDEKRDQSREQLGVESLYESFDDFVSDERIDAIALFTPAPLHAEQSIKAIKAGKHVLCAVPAVMDMAEAKSLVEVASQSDRIYMMAENWVYEPAVERAHELYGDGALGQIYYAEAEYYHGVQGLRRHPDGSPTWRNSLEPLLYPTHGTSPYLHMTGDRFTEAMGFAASGRAEFADGYEVDWIQTAMFRTEKGGLFRLSNSFQNIHKVSHFLSFHGDEGSFETGRFNEARTVCHYSQGGDKQLIREVCEHSELSQFGESLGRGHGKTSIPIVLNFVASIQNGTQPSVDLMSALDMTLPGITGVQSVRSGNWEAVPDPRTWV